MPAPFWVVDLTPTGEIRLRQDYEYQFLEKIPGAGDLISLFSAHVWREPAQFNILLPGGRLTFRWRACADTAGIATLREGPELISLSLLLCGRDLDADAAVKKSLQIHLVRELHDTGYEPAFDLMNISDRPLLASIHFRPPTQPEDQQLFALADRCFAASYFRKKGLA
jgi:hypothetical protein